MFREEEFSDDWDDWGEDEETETQGTTNSHFAYFIQEFRGFSLSIKQCIHTLGCTEVDYMQKKLQNFKF